mgnify:CR=1 FL=1
MNDVALVQIVNSVKHLADSLRSILLRELSVLADSVEQLSAHGQLSDDIEFVLIGS